MVLKIVQMIGGCLVACLFIAGVELGSWLYPTIACVIIILYAIYIINYVKKHPDEF